MPNHDELERISPERAGIESSQVRRCLEKLTNEWASMHGFMAARNGQVFAECFWSPYSKDLVHGNNSLGKTYTGTAVGIALMEHKLSLEEKMTDIFAEEIKERNIEVSELMKEIRIRDVLTMTNGHARHPEIGEDWIGDYFRTSMKYKPGTRFMYNTSGACMLSAVIKKKTGQNLKEYLTPRLFDEIGINGERFVWLKWPNGLDAEPATFSTTEDNLRLALLYMNGGSWNGRQLVDPGYIKEALSVQIENEYAPEQKDGKCGYGYQLWACSIPGVYRFDGAQGQYGIVWPKKRVAVAVHEGAIAPYGPQRTLDVIYEELLLKIAEEPLEENEEEYNRLLEIEKHMEFMPDRPNDITPDLDLSGKYIVTEGDPTPWLGLAPPGGADMFALYRAKDRKGRMEEFRLEMKEDRCILEVNGYARFEAGFDGKLVLRNTDNVFPDLTAYSATARYINGYTLEITIHWMSSWALTIMRFEKQNGTVKITAMKNRLNQEDNWLVYKGEARGVKP
ncbi:hypothetical protein EAI28_22160 [Faecalicatena contorta]|uniref:serine hydrolase domain-containing protein n=3 Tax=Faecalicatena contorta TaxID=39482 RepID=UPI00129DAE44|nr:serine hydrolase [Faecalicatena contorta]MEE0201630.1 serine hydrolase [Muricomes sp.]MRM91032.1 hypothetical protein [Faecalicatena contorta]